MSMKSNREVNDDIYRLQAHAWCSHCKASQMEDARGKLCGP